VIKVNYSSPAKINLFLSIRSKRPDGYHEIVNLMQTVDICDDISISRSARSYSTLKSKDASIPFGKRNLCIKAYDIIKQNTMLDDDDTIEISLNKRIPLGSGLGGGSSNAACVIKGMNEVFKLSLSVEDQRKLSSHVGSDVPFFTTGGLAILTGRGEIVDELPELKSPLNLVIIKPDFSVSTGEAYKWLKETSDKQELNREELISHIENNDLEYITDKMHNDFEPVIENKYPFIGKLKDIMLEHGCIKSQLTGSGSGLFGVCENIETAKSIAEQMSEIPHVSFAKCCKTI